MNTQEIPPAAPARPSPTSNGLLYHALPDDQTITTQLNDAGAPTMIFPGRIVLTPPMAQALADRASNFWYPGAKGQQSPRFKWVVNLLADPDRYANALTHLQGQLRSSSAPVFNPPDRILATSRHRVWQTLSDVDSLIAPRCERFTPRHPRDFHAAFEAGGFDYPVLVRPAGSHTGADLALIENAQDWDKIFTISWAGRPLYMTQWTDFRSEAGEWRKLRLVITPQHIRLRHILFGDDWLIHASDRDAETAERELAILLDTDNWTALQSLGNAIRDRIGLDYFGVDLGWKSDSEFVLFEANASMSILSTSSMPTHRRADYLRVLKQIESDVWTAFDGFCSLQRSPTQWP